MDRGWIQSFIPWGFLIDVGWCPLRQAKASRESAAGRSGALRALLEASTSGGVLEGAGVCGRLGDLGVVGAEYDVAVRDCC